MNASDVTGPCTAVQYGLIMLTCGSRKMGFRHHRKPMRRNAELYGRFSLVIGKLNHPMVFGRPLIGGF